MRERSFNHLRKDNAFLLLMGDKKIQNNGLFLFLTRFYATNEYNLPPFQPQKRGKRGIFDNNLSEMVIILSILLRPIGHPFRPKSFRSAYVPVAWPALRRK